jgi:hypothetical protein
VTLILALTLASCGQGQYEADKRQCGDDPVCMRARGWHDAGGIRNFE